MSRAQPLLNPLAQTHLSATRVMPGSSGQRDFDLGFTTLGIDKSHLGFAMLLPALVAIANPVSGE
jgi:hypothetical protein